jgi:mRNA deadenylase 3'-5' endonuclease subunit Ccr4
MNTGTYLRTTALGLTLAGLVLAASGCGLQQKAECNELAEKVKDGATQLTSSTGNADAARAAGQKFVDDLNKQAADIKDEELKKSVQNFASKYQAVVDYIVKAQTDPVAAAKDSQQVGTRMEELTAAGKQITDICG